VLDRIVRPKAWRPVFLIALASAIAGLSCGQSGYARETAANVSLLSGLADKLGDYARTGFMIGERPLSSEEMGEFYYAFNKASEFSSSTPREQSLRSHRDFVKLLNTYEHFVHSADQYRLAGKPDPAVLAALLSDRDQVRHLAGAVMEDLRAERH
jgi:hypothetical protein